MNKNTHTILNYITVVDMAKVSLINMLDGPTARAGRDEQFDEEGYRSQEIFTQEKFAYLYYKGLLLLEFLFDNGMTHGHINANSLTIADDFTFTLSDFPLSTVTKNFSNMNEQQQQEVKTQVRGFNKHTVNEEVRQAMTSLIDCSLNIKSGALTDESMKQAAHQTLGVGKEYLVSNLMKEDWRDMVTTFYFPRLAKMITDQRLRDFIENTNRELLEPDQEARQIKMIAEKAHRFLLANIWILEELLFTLQEE